MLVHLGEDIMVPYRRVIAILSLRAISASHDSRTFMSWADQRGRVFGNSSQARSAVLTDDGVYLSPISPDTLKRRLGQGSRGFQT